MERTPEEKIETEISLHEKEAILCRSLAEKIPEERKHWLRRAEVCEIAAHNARVFLRGRAMVQTGGQA